MKGKWLKKSIALLSAVCLLTASACGGGGEKSSALPKDATILVKVGANTEKYERSTDISTLNYDKIDIAAAKGETEGGQFLVNANFDGAYDVTVGDLVNGDATIAKENISICTQIYSECNEREYGGFLPAGWYPDCLIPVQYMKSEGENLLEKGVNQAFWVDVSIPRDATAGVYTTEITFECRGLKGTVPLSVEVYDFEISEVTALESAYSIWDEWIFYGEGDNSTETIRKYYDYLTKYNLAAGLPSFNTAEEFVANVREFYPKLRAYCVVPPRNPMAGGGYYYDVFKDMLYLLTKASVEDGVNYFDKAYYNFSSSYDEAANSSALDEMTALINGYEEEVIEKLAEDGVIASDSEIAETIRSLRHLITIDKIWAFSENVNFVCPKTTMLQYSSDIAKYVQLAEEQDFRVWTYNCVGGDMYPFYSAEINDYYLTTRENMWANYVNGFKGMLYWCVTGFCDWGATPFEKGKDVYSYGLVKDLYTTASHEGKTNGDGYLLYPGAPYGSDMPFASMRLTALRDGADDFTYMTQLDEAYKAYGEAWGIDGLSATPFVSYLTEDIIGRNSSKLNSEATMNARDTLADAIVATNNEKFVIADLSRVNNEIRYTFYADASASVSLGGNALVGENEGNGAKKYAGTYTLQAGVNELEIKVGDRTVSIPTGNLAKVFADFESDTTAMKLENGSTAVVDATHAMSGNSAKVTLTGNSEDVAFRPYVHFDAFSGEVKLTDVSSLEFYVYNDSDEYLETTLYLQVTENKVNSKSIYDKYYLRPHAWTKIEIDNVQVLGWRENRLKQVSGFGLTFKNPTSPITLYVDEVSYKEV